MFFWAMEARWLISTPSFTLTHTAVLTVILIKTRNITLLQLLQADQPPGAQTRSSCDHLEYNLGSISILPRRVIVILSTCDFFCRCFLLMSLTTAVVVMIFSVNSGSDVLENRVKIGTHDRAQFHHVYDLLRQLMQLVTVTCGCRCRLGRLLDEFLRVPVHEVERHLDYPENKSQHVGHLQLIYYHSVAIILNKYTHTHTHIYTDGYHAWWDEKSLRTAMK